MSVSATMAIQAQLDSYRNAVLGHANLVAYWRLNESAGTIATDESDASFDGTYTGSYTLAQTGALSDGSTGVDFVSQAGYVDLGVHAQFSPTSAFSVEAWCKPLRSFISSTNYEIFGNEYFENYGILLRLESNHASTPTAGRIHARTNQLGGTSQLTTADLSAINIGNWCHVVWTWDGTNGRLYLNGSLVLGPTAQTAPVVSTVTTYIGAGRTSPQRFNGIIDEVAFYNAALSATTITQHYSLRTDELWVTLADTVGANGVRLHYGVTGNGPLDCIAGPGELHFSLRNDPRNAGATQGWYSPSHTNRRPGWTFGVPIRVRITYDAVTYTKWIGKVRKIDPEPGRYRGQVVHVTAYDYVQDLLETNAREVTVQINKTEAELIEAVLDALPAMSQPLARDIDVGVDTYPQAFDNAKGDVKALTLIKQAATSALGFVAIKGDGTLIYRSRHTRALAVSSYTFADTMHDLSVPSTLDNVYNRVRATNHPKTISATATDELYAVPSGGAIEISAGATVEVWTDYTDPNDRQVHIGGTAVVTTLVGGTHYVANTAADGSGSNVTANITASIDPFSSTAKWTLTNNGGSTAYMTTLKVIGKAIRDLGPQTYEYAVDRDYGDRPLDIDLPYQDDPFIASSAATYIVTAYADLEAQINDIGILANVSDDFMTQALEREPGDRITVTEYATGISTDAMIQSVAFEISQNVIIRCKWGLAPANTVNFWLLGTVGASELGDTTTLGF